MENKKLNSKYWTKHYEEGHIPWDLGKANPAILQLFETMNRGTRILIPGAGNAHEWRALKEMGFKQIWVLDFSPLPIEKLKAAYPEYERFFLLQDFFKHEGRYDVILEHTFLSALPPNLRTEYVEKMHALLAPEGKLMGLIFDGEFEKEGPPFGGTAAEYQRMFSTHFDRLELHSSKSSMEGRQELQFFAWPKT